MNKFPVCAKGFITNFFSFLRIRKQWHISYHQNRQLDQLLKLYQFDVSTVMFSKSGKIAKLVSLFTKSKAHTKKATTDIHASSFT